MEIQNISELEKIMDEVLNNTKAICEGHDKETAKCNYDLSVCGFYEKGKCRIYETEIKC
jgi:hypothetical protein